MFRKAIEELFFTQLPIIMDRVSSLKELLKDSPKDCFLLHALGLEHQKIGALPAAQSYFEQVLAADPTYVGTYYHLAKLMEQIGDIKQAVVIYEKGMEEAKKVSDMHAYNELRSAWEELTF